ncbi:hypothetical protein F4811DRAFT_398534 [Daldinia bambusicola]|nr:hypothetical protein F4811DRAFT_398534 [Daldinia bambusicola]
MAQATATAPTAPRTEARSKANSETDATQAQATTSANSNTTTNTTTTSTSTSTTTTAATKPPFLSRRQGEEVYEALCSSMFQCNGTLNDGLGKASNSRRRRDVRRWLLAQMRGPRDEAEYRRRASDKAKTGTGTGAPTATTRYGYNRYARK